MCYINLHFTYLITYLRWTYDREVVGSAPGQDTISNYHYT